VNIDERKKPRAALKSYFVKNAIPTEDQFAQLIDSGLNQRDDGVVKLADGPLSIEAAGDATSPKKALDLYSSFTDPNPAWSVALRPRQNPADPSSGRLGLSINDAAGSSRLCIDGETGRVGIGTTIPSEPLEVNGRLKAGDLSIGPWPANPAGYVFVGASTNTLNQASAANYALLQGLADGPGRTFLNSPVAIHFRITNVDKMVMTSKGDLGIGTDSPQAKLEVRGGAIMPSAGYGEDFGILFPRDPRGGAGDRAWIRYYPRSESGEAMTLAIGIENDAHDHIALLPSGGVGINMIDPAGFRLNIAGREGLHQNTLSIAGDQALSGHDRVNLVKIGSSGDYQLLHKASGAMRRNTLALHCHADDALGFYSSGFTPLLEVEGSSGNTYVRGKLASANLFGGASFRINAGSTPPGNTNWFDAGPVVLGTVDTSAGGFTTTPLYFASLINLETNMSISAPWISGPHDTSKNNFTIDLVWQNPGPSAAELNQMQVHIAWIGIEFVPSGGPASPPRPSS
jgi:hypothetical protein